MCTSDNFVKGKANSFNNISGARPRFHPYRPTSTVYSSNQNSPPEILNIRSEENGASLWELGTTPISTSQLNILLSEYPKKDTAEFLHNGFVNGFRLQYTGPRGSYFAENLKSAKAQPKLINEKLSKKFCWIE